jgi:MYXO-CTERM domain-containing protein
VGCKAVAPERDPPDAQPGEVPTARAEIGGPAAYLGPEHEVDPPVYLPTVGEEVYGLVFAGTQWVSVRESSSARLQRIALDGTVLDPLGVALDADDYDTVGLASDGVIVAAAYPTTSSPRQLVFRRFDQSLGPIGVPLSVASLPGDDSPTVQPSITYGDGQYLVVWGDGGIRAARVSAAGVLLDAQPITIASTGSTASVEVTWDGEHFLIVWRDGVLHGAVHARQLSADGQPGDGFEVAADGFALDVVSSGGVYLVTWVVIGPSSNSTVLLARRWSADLEPLDAQPWTLMTGSPWQSGAHCSVVGDRFVLSWTDDHLDTVHAQFVPVTGAPQPPLLIGTGAYGWPVLIADAGSVALALWYQQGTRLDTDGAVLDPAGIRVAQRTNEEHQPRVAAGRNSQLAVWVDERPDDRESGSSIYAIRLGDDGTPLDPASFLISPNPGWVGFPAVSFDGTQFLVAWRVYDRTEARLLAVRVAADGTVLDTAPITVAVTSDSSDIHWVAVSGAAGSFVVGWTEGGQARARTIAADGSMPGPAFPLGPSSFQGTLEVGFDGEHHVVVWNPPGIDGLSMATVAPGAIAADGPALQLTDRATEAFALAAGAGGNYVAWRHVDATGVAVFGTGFDSDGTVAHPEGETIIPRQPGGLSDLALARDADGFTLSWSRSLSTGYDVQATRLRADGARIAGVLSLNDLPGSTTDARVTTTGEGTTLVTYLRDDPSPRYQATRARARQFTPLAAGSSCDVDAACAGGYCVDGVCCDVACGGSADDCQACSVAAGAAVDGTCGPVGAGQICRGAAGSCDVAEACDGASTTCPADGAAADGTSCSDGTCTGGVCVEPPDASLPDAMVDAAVVDAAVVDAAVVDASSDADATIADAAVVDAAVVVDAGTDATPVARPDAGHDVEPADDGCGCSSSSGPDRGSVLLFGVALLILGRHRRPRP